jgi:hypothetical protein
MTTEHPVLTGIREGVRANGSYRCHWGNLRREVFPDQAAWVHLRNWCAENDLECQLSFGEASKHAEVHFMKAMKDASPAPAPTLGDTAEATPTPA